MVEYAGPVLRLTLVRGLALLPLVPLVALVVLLVVAARGRGDPPARREGVMAVVVAGAAAVVLVVAAVFVAVLLPKPAGERALLEPLFRLARVGTLDVRAALLFDPLAAGAIVAAGAVALAAAVVAARRRTGDGRGVPLFIGLTMALLSAVVVALGDGFFVVVVGVATSGVAGAVVLAAAGAGEGEGAGADPPLRASSRLLTFGAAADAAYLFGALLLFWGLGGTWFEGEYTAEPESRFLCVRAMAAPPIDGDPSRASWPGDEGTSPTKAPDRLTLTGAPGATVFLDDARAPLERAPGEALRAPFRRWPLPAGVHTLRIQASDGLDESVVPPVSFGAPAAEGEILLVPRGPTVTFREVEDQLALRDRRDAPSLLRALLERRVGPFSLAGVVSVLLSAGALARGFALLRFAAPLRPSLAPFEGPVRAIAALGPLSAAYLLLRLRFLFQWVPVAYVGAGALVAAVAFAVESAAEGRRLGGAHPLDVVASFVASFDRWVVGGSVAGFAVAVRALSWTVASVDDLLVRGAVHAAARGVAGAGGVFRSLEPRRAMAASRSLFAVVGLVLLLYYLLLKR